MSDVEKFPNGLPALKDDLDREVSLEAKLDQSGLSAKGKSRALAALDVLVGSLIGLPAGELEAFRRRRAIRHQEHEEMLRAQSVRAIEVLRETDDLGRLAAERFVQQERRKQLNREAVWIETEEALKALPPPTTTDELEPGGEAIDPDWLNLFARHAEDASSVRLQEMWGHVLAREIRKPGAQSFSTLRVIAELDQKIAELFQHWVRLRIGDRILKPEPLQGSVLTNLSLLEEAGLLIDVAGSRNLIMRERDGKTHLFGDRYGLAVTPKHNELQLPIIALTRVGMEIAAILPNDEIDALREVVEYFDKKGLSEGVADFLIITGRREDIVTAKVLPAWPDRTQSKEPPA